MKIHNSPIKFLYYSSIWGYTAWSSSIMQESSILTKLRIIREASIMHLYLPAGPTSYQWYISHSMVYSECKFNVSCCHSVMTGTGNTVTKHKYNIHHCLHFQHHADEKNVTSFTCRCLIHSWLKDKALEQWFPRCAPWIPMDLQPLLRGSVDTFL